MPDAFGKVKHFDDKFRNPISFLLALSPFVRRSC
jgi:hypothetical protein